MEDNNKFIGNLTNLTNRTLSGWVFQVASEEPLLVDILINNQLIETIRADKPLLFLKNHKIHPTGVCGFRWKIPNDIDLDEIIIINVYVHDSFFELKTSPLMRNDFQRYFFMHIPKTAGTSFRYLLDDHLGKENIFPNKRELKRINNGKYLPLKAMIMQKELWLNDQKKMVAGHYPYSFRRFFHNEVKVLTFVREPIERTISQILHFQKNHPSFQNKSVSEIIKPNGNYNPLLKNVQSRILGYRTKKDNFDEVKQNIKKIDFIGITEKFEASINKCNELMGWNLKSEKRVNESNLKKKKNFNREKFMADLIALNELDLKTYKEILAQQKT